MCFLLFPLSKNIPNADLFKEHINPVVLINLKLYVIIKKVYLFQLVAFKIYPKIKTVYYFNWLPWTYAGSSQ